ncbi:hypothetical protein [Caudoviricetes sp.]|nr:hypothetical protein [Caudoviricetes sp.]
MISQIKVRLFYLLFFIWCWFGEFYFLWVVQGSREVVQ